VELHHGRVINMPGDSVLAIFDTATGAVAAALGVQRALDQRVTGTAGGARLRFRIGVHLGDVIEREGGDIHGDGVNIAARLQAIAEPGGIVVSEAVRGAVKTRVAATFVDRGMQTVKNIADPVHAYAVGAETAPPPVQPAGAAPPRRGVPRAWWYAAAAAVVVVAVVVVAWLRSGEAPVATAPVAAPAPAKAPAPAAAPPGKPSIAVLPFDNMSGDADKAYFADGMTEDLITDLSKVAGLVVIARNSTFQYKGKARDVREIGKALNARYVLEGSVRRSGDSVRVNAQLIDAASGAHVWADRYDGELRNVFALQDTITSNVVKALSVELTRDDKERFARRGTGNVPAYDAYLRGWEHYLKQTPEDFRAATVEFKKALELDPGYARAHAALAATHWAAYTRWWTQAAGFGVRNEEALYAAEQHLARAMRSPTALAHQVASAMLLHQHQQAEAVVEAKRAIASDPNDADGYIALAAALSFTGRGAEALSAVDQAMRLNPHYPSSYPYQRGLAEFNANRLDAAAAALERSLQINPDDHWAQRLLLATYGLQGRRDDAAKLMSAIQRKDRRGASAFQDPLTIRAIAFWYPFANADDAKRLATGLGKAGVPD
jgi:TolB-like protein/Flp pilus assembly protein TadD